MFEWIGDNLWVLWLTLGVGLAVVEVMVLDLVFLMLAAGATAALVGALAGADAWVQIALFAAVSLLMLVVVRPTALKHLKKGPAEQLTNVDTLPGRTVVVVEETSSTAGLVKIDGEVWTARSDSDQPLAVGSEAEIERVDGATLLVMPRPAIDWGSADSPAGDPPDDDTPETPDRRIP